MSKEEITEQELYAEIMNEVNEGLGIYEKECKRVNDRIFKAIENQIGKGFLSDLKILIEECECRGSFKLTQDVGSEYTKPKFQQETDYGCIVGMWVYQYSVGDSGDSFAGTIWVKLKDYKYLEMDFSC